MKVTVVINCYNSKEFIAETANSLSAQSFKDFTVLFVDNHSTDNSFEIFNSNSNFEIKYLKTNKFISLYCARNFAITYLDSYITCFLDADDLWSPNYLQDVIYFHEQNPEIDSCQAKTYAFNDINSPKELTINLRNKNLIKLSDFAKMPFTALGGLSIKNRFFKDYRFPMETNFIGDLDLVLNLSSKNQLFFLEEVSFYYRIHPGGLTSKNLKGWQKELNCWLLNKNIDIPEILLKKLNSDLVYISLRTLINKLNLYKFAKIVFKSSLKGKFKIKLLIRKLINKP